MKFIHIRSRARGPVSLSSSPLSRSFKGKNPVCMFRVMISGSSGTVLNPAMTAKKTEVLSGPVPAVFRKIILRRRTTSVFT